MVPPFIRLQDLVPDPTTTHVYPGVDGDLVYEPDEQGNVIPDFSYAGYKGGGVRIPTVPVRETIWPVPGDNTEHIQAAIDRVSALPLDESGFRGALVLKAGYYRMATPITIRASGVVLRGEGMGDTGTILFGTGTGRAAAPGGGPGGPGGPGGGGPGGPGGPGGGGGIPGQTLVYVAGTGAITLQEDTSQTVTDAVVPVGGRTFTISNARNFSVGDTVIVRRIGNQDWINELGMTGEDGSATWRPFNIDFDRTIVAIDGNRITIDAPITTAIEEQFGGAEVIRYEEGGRIENVGIENLRGVSEFDPTVRTTEWGNMDRENFTGEEYYSDENHWRNFIIFDNIRDAWVRDCTALHFVYSFVGTSRGAKSITIQDCVSREPISMIAGARRFIFALRGQLALVQRCQSDKGRHSFMTGQPTACGNVFLDCSATLPYSSSEPHEQWANGTLYDNVEAPLTARFWYNFSIGWAGANTVFWNCEGDFLVQKPPTAQNYAFGHIGVNAVVFNTALQDPRKPNGHIESQGRHVAPRSLYLTQLGERLGEQAVRNVASGSQLG